jgi:hypothetical protein
MIFSNTLENKFNREIGLQLAMFSLSPFLNSGFTMEYFKQVGKVPDLIDLQQI